LNLNLAFGFFPCLRRYVLLLSGVALRDLRTRIALNRRFNLHLSPLFTLTGFIRKNTFALRASESI